MAGFCEVCGRPLAAGGQCPDETCQEGRRVPQPDPPENKVDAPPAPRGRRLLGSGVEFTLYVTAAVVIAILDGLTFGALTVLSLVLAAVVALRDLHAGAFSLAKRVANMRVVDWRTGRIASNAQAVFRNVYYLLLVLVAVLPGIDCFLIPVLLGFIALDVTMIVANPRGRRLGDLLAGTQVVATRS